MINQLCLQQHCSWLYKKLLQQLASSRSTLTDEQKWIECGFGITAKTWFGIQQEVASYLFNDQREEIAFYKVLKPRFESLMDYFTLLYKSALFQPDDLPAKKEYWDHELTICKNFLSKHQSFYHYYEQCNTCMDHIYFVQENNQQSPVFGANENKPDRNATYSHLLARLLSIKKYQTYIEEKICSLTNIRPN